MIGLIERLRAAGAGPEADEVDAVINNLFALVADAYDEGFDEGVIECRLMQCGKRWEESHAHSRLHNCALMIQE